MNILYQVSYVPSLIRTRPYNFIRGLIRRGHSITLATLWETENDRRCIDDLSKLNSLDVIAFRINRVRIINNLVDAFFSGTPLQANYSWKSELANAIKNEILNKEYDVFHCEHLRGARYGLYIQKEFERKDINIPVVYDSVDSISLIYARAVKSTRNFLWRWITRFELPRTRRYESLLTTKFKNILVTTSIDKENLIKLSQQLGRGLNKSLGEHINVVSNGVALDYFDFFSGERQSNTIIFSGKMSYHANYSMALYLINEVMPLIWSRQSDAQLFVVGKSPSKKIRALASNDYRIMVTGFVPDLRPYLQKATVAVVPLLYGSGIQNKILEAMACGTPVVVSSLAARPLHDSAKDAMIIVDDPQATADAILNILNDKGLQERLSNSGRKYVERFHDWNNSVEKLEKIYNKAQ